MIKITTAIMARKKFGQLLEEVFYRRDEFIIERAGKPMAVLIPIQEFEKWQKQREKDFMIFDKIRAKAKGAKIEEVEKEVTEAVVKVRKNA
ncbi:MAG: type II toxin-antitoxin system Phd/YefM family antitoxin [Candidatus Subteraquimicrobiales bacterium]|nr:type II toxin-antitoxin system Phd/YefM family antitoxin [Candidatus Subteraquimicrobiales bacterium]